MGALVQWLITALDWLAILAQRGLPILVIAILIIALMILYRSGRDL